MVTASTKLLSHMKPQSSAQVLLAKKQTDCSKYTLCFNVPRLINRSVYKALFPRHQYWSCRILSWTNVITRNFTVLLTRCSESDCNGLLRPNVVFFGETLDSHLLTKVEKELEICDLCLVVSNVDVILLLMNQNVMVLILASHDHKNILIGEKCLVCRMTRCVPDIVEAPWMHRVADLLGPFISACSSSKSLSNDHCEVLVVPVEILIIFYQ